MRMKRSSLTYFAFSFLLILLYACISGSDSETSYNTSSDTGTITFALSLQEAPSNDADRHAAQQIDCADIKSVEGHVYDENNKLLVSGGPWECEAGEGTISGVPAGENRKVVVLCKDSSDDICHLGETIGITVIAGQSNTAGTITLSPNYQVFYTSDIFPADYIDQKWDEGYSITSVAYGDGMWAVVMSQGTDFGYQGWATRSEFSMLDDFIYLYWDEGYRISDLAYGNGLWAVVISQGTNYTDQYWDSSDIYPEELIYYKWDEGYYITSLAYGDGTWAVVMSEGTQYTNQGWQTSTDFPSDYINEKWAAGRYITSLIYGDRWAVVMSERTVWYTDQWWATRYDFPSDFIYVKWAEGYSITSLTYGDGIWAVVMSK